MSPNDEQADHEQASDISQRETGPPSAGDGPGRGRQRAEEAMPGSEERLLKVCPASFEGILIHDNGRILDANQTLARMLGYERHELIGMQTSLLLAPESRDVPLQNRLSGREEPYEAVGLRRDGSTFPAELCGRAIPYDGRTVRAVAVRDIAERRRAEETLRESEERFRRLCEASFEGIAIHDKGKILDANQTLVMMLGYELSEFVGMEALDLVAPESRDLVLQNVLSGHEEPYEALCLRRDGSAFVAEICGKAIPYDERMVRVTAVRDITERKRAEEALENLATFPGENPNPIIRVARNGTVIFANQSSHPLLELWGSAEGASLPAEPYQQVESALTTGKLVTGETVCGDRTFLVICAPIAGRDYVNIYGVDITERKRAEEALRESERRYRLLAENASDVIWTMDTNLRFTYVSPSVARLRGYSPQEAMAQTMAEFLTPGSLAVATRAVADQRVIEQTGQKDLTRSLTLELEQTCKDGSTVWTEVKMTFLRDEDNRVVEILGIGRDITERKRAEEALRKSKELFEKTFLSQRDALFILDAQAPPTIVDCNPAAAESFGYTRQEMLGRTTAFLHVDEGSLREFQEHLYPAAEDPGFLHLLDFRMKRKDGTVFPTEHSVMPLRDEQGKRIGWVSVVRDITERKRAQEALRESEERFRQVAETARVWIWEFDAGGRFTYSSPAVKDILGYEPEEVIGKRCLDVVIPQDRQRLVAETRATLTTKGTFFRLLIQKIHKDGHTVVVESTGLPVLDAQGNVLGYRGVDQDITERKRAEDEARKFKTISDRAGYGCAMSDLEGKLTYVNKAFAHMHGYEPEELIGKNLSVFHNEEQMGNVDRLKKRLTEKGSYVAEEVWHKRKDDSLFPTLMTGTVIGDEKGNPLFMAATATDITERKRAEEALREREERFRQVAQTSREWIWEFDAGGRFTYSSPAVKDILGYEPEEVIGKHCLDIVIPQERPRLVAEAGAILARKGTFFRLVTEKIHKDGHTVVVESTGLPTLDAEGNMVGYRGVDQDITERKRAEEALKDSERRYRLLAENATDIIWTTDLDLRFTYVSPSVTRLGGYSVREMVGGTITAKEALTPASFEIAVAALAEELAIEKMEQKDLLRSRTLELEHRRKDGSTVWAEVRMTALRDEDSRLVEILGVSRDITERKRAEEALQRAREELESRVERQVQRGNAYGLTFRELTVLHLVAAGESDKEIAAVLGISRLTAHKHLANILKKMGAACRTEAGVRAVREGLVD